MSYILRRLINVYFPRYCLPIIHGFVSINHVVIAGSKLGNIIELGICKKKKKNYLLSLGHYQQKIYGAMWHQNVRERYDN